MDAIDRYIQALGDPVVRSYWRKANQIDEEEGPGPDDGSKVSEQRLAAAEQELGFALPPSYRKLVTTTEPYDGVPVGWIIDPDKICNDLVTTYLNSYHPLPPFLMAVIEEPNGDAYCFDMRHPDERGQYPIVHLDHEVHNEDSTEFETVAGDLGEFLLGSLGERLLHRASTRSRRWSPVRVLCEHRERPGHAPGLHGLSGRCSGPCSR